MFTTNLSFFCKKRATLKSSPCMLMNLSLRIGLFVSEFPDIFFVLIIPASFNLGITFSLSGKSYKIVSRTIFHILYIYIFCVAVTSASYVFCLLVFQIWLHSFTDNEPWLPYILLLFVK